MAELNGLSSVRRESAANEECGPDDHNDDAGDGEPLELRRRRQDRG
jgi:hypothetical protein